MGQDNSWGQKDEGKGQKEMKREVKEGTTKLEAFDPEQQAVWTGEPAAMKRKGQKEMPTSLNKDKIL